MTERLLLTLISHNIKGTDRWREYNSGSCWNVMFFWATHVVSLNFDTWHHLETATGSVYVNCIFTRTGQIRGAALHVMCALHVLCALYALHVPCMSPHALHVACMYPHALHVPCMCPACPLCPACALHAPCALHAHRTRLINCLCFSARYHRKHSRHYIHLCHIYLGQGCFGGNLNNIKLDLNFCRKCIT